MLVSDELTSPLSDGSDLKMSSQLDSRVRSVPAWAVLTPLVIAFLVVFWSTGVWMVDRWSAPGSYYGHGWLIPLLSLFVLGRNLRKREIQSRPAFVWGAVLLLVGAGLHGASLVARVHFTSAVAALVLILGLVLLLSGPALFRTVLFPVLFLGFMIPMPLVSIAALSLELKLLATELGAGILNFAGVEVRAEGAQLLFPGDKLIVGEACSGLRSLIALVSFSVLFAAISPIGPVRKVILSLFSVPLALIANAARLVVLGIITAIWSSAAVQGLVHDASGLSIYLVAFVGLFLFEKGLRKLWSSENRRVGSGPKGGSGSVVGLSVRIFQGRLARSGALPVVAILAGLGFVTLRLDAGAPAVKERNSSSAIPSALGPFEGRDVELSERTYRQLETRDIVFRSYSRSGSRAVNLCIVFGGSNRKTAHPPEVCYEGGGDEVDLKKVVEIPDWVTPSGEQSGFSGHLLLVSSPRGPRCVLYWYASGDRFGPGYFSHQVEMALGAVQGIDRRGAMVRLSVPLSSAEEFPTASEYLVRFAQLLAPSLRVELTS